MFCRVTFVKYFLSFLLLLFFVWEILFTFKEPGDTYLQPLIVFTFQSLINLEFISVCVSIKMSFVFQTV